MVRLLFLVFFIGLFGVRSADAQTATDCDCFVKGVVKDRETNLPIAGALLSIKNTAKVAVTDAEGHYRIERLCQGNYVLECKIIGYKTARSTISLQHSAEENVNLNEDEVHLQDVEIVARRLSSLTQPAASLQNQALEQTRGQTLAGALQKIAGVTMLQTGASIAKPVIHGLHSNRILIINNGIRQEGQQWGSEHAPEIDPFIAKRLTVVKGAAGVRYGSDAIGGVILVEPAELPYKAVSVGGEINTVGFTNGRTGVLSGTLEGGINKWKGFGWRVQGTLKNGGNIQTPDYFLANTGVREQNFSVSGGYRSTKLGAEVFYSQFHTNLGIFSGSHIGSTSDLLNVIKNGEPFIKADFTRTIERPNQLVDHDLLKLKVYHQFSGNRVSLTFGRQYNQRAEYDLHGPQAAIKPALLFRITTLTGDMVLEHKPLKEITGQIGLSGLHQYNFTDGRPLIPDFEQSNAGAFVIERLVRQKWEWEAGLRYDLRWLHVYRFTGQTLDQRNHQFNSWSGTVGSVFNANARLVFRTNFGTGWRPPSVNELYSKGVHHGAAAYEEGEATLQPETAYNLQGNVEYTSERFRAEIGLFHNSIRNFIYLKPQPEPILTIRGAFPYFKYVQANATFSGADITTEWNMAPRWEHTGKISYLRAYDQAANDYLVAIPANRLENGFRYQISDAGPLHDSFVSIGHLWVAEQKRVPPNSDFMPPPAAYHLWSLQVGGDILLTEKQKITWDITAQNLFNAAYRDYLNRFRYYSLEQGRNVSVRLKWSF
ncbi:TonB-dependent receptor [Runella slithyformis]|uniref:TonB-dependent receptor n=1 Tax=Runella slithyformis (strain ATCC 29530 / DSM 19594 / LMG 11500 / NCIMB 11436 / LSU 4) TaxID=761193 RepID=A0A7U3ZIU5_RUNSL|nr:TonB-dependent receptor [Runella slithyformis]AEI48015.1 TonB-dependent receptor [Runella slithyformis DSM 19594]